MVKVNKCNRGSFTVEAAIIFPVAVLTLAAVIYLCLLLYQSVLVQAVISNAAEMGAATWNNSCRELSGENITGANADSDGLYSQLLDSNAPLKKKRISAYIADRLGKYDLLPCSYTIIEPEFVNYLVYRKLKLKVESRYRLPIGRLLQILGLKNHIVISSAAEAVITSPAEFIRNLDFAMDITGLDGSGSRESEESNEGTAWGLNKLGDVIKKFSGN